jgi:hypothetical protein
MKKLQQLCATVVLTLAFALSAFAGDMSFPGVTAPPPPPQQSSATGDIGMPGAFATGEMSGPGVVALDPAIGTALSLLQSIFSIF